MALDTSGTGTRRPRLCTHPFLSGPETRSRDPSNSPGATTRRSPPSSCPSGAEMSEFLDELARAMARPMPRSRAVRVLGSALVTAVVPSSVRAAAAHASPRSAGACPPAPTCDSKPGTSFCGIPNIGNDGCTRYIYVCCPTTGPNAQPLCCKGKGEVQCCGPCDKCGEEKRPGGSVNIICVHGGGCKRCGPDITGALEDAVSRTEAAFAWWSPEVRSVACISLVGTPIGTFGWEINQLGPGGQRGSRRALSTRLRDVHEDVVGSGRGWMSLRRLGQLRHLWRDAASLPQRTSRVRSAITRSTSPSRRWLGTSRSGRRLRGAPNLTASLNWAKAGYNDWPSAPTPHPSSRTAPTVRRGSRVA